jgi:O-antigen ligase
MTPFSARQHLSHLTLQKAVMFFCGATLLWAVGVQYLTLLLVSVIFFAYRFWKHPTFTAQMRHVSIPILFFLGWIVLTLLLQTQTYDETLSHTFHAARIALTLALFMALPPELARTALHGAWFGLALVLALLALQALHWIPPLEYWSHLTSRGTNKSIGASIMLSLFAVSVFAWFLQRNQMGWRALGLIGFLLLLILIVFVVGKRTAMIGVAIGIFVVLLHLLRKHGKKLTAALALTALGLTSTVALSPGLQNEWLRGIHEARKALDGEVAVESWNIRIQMMRHTAEMIEEKPLMGWGMGGWNTQWKTRAHEMMNGFNMPHNDLLWIGSESGVIGSMAWLVLMLAPLVPLWRMQGWRAAAASAAVAVALISSLVNNGTRDATLGLPMLMLVGILYANAFLRPSAKESDPSMGLHHPPLQTPHR